jgi:hypothetical protein
MVPSIRNSVALLIGVVAIATLSALLTNHSLAQVEQLWRGRPQPLGGFPAPPGCVAFSVRGEDTSFADANLIDYSSVTTNEGGGYIGHGIFLAPSEGLYFFTMSFVRDEGYTKCNGSTPTSDDVYMLLYVGNAEIGRAWAGESDQHSNPVGTWSDRSTGTYSVVVHLNRGDEVTTYAYSDGTPGNEFCRHLMMVNWTGFKVPCSD